MSISSTDPTHIHHLAELDGARWFELDTPAVPPEEGRKRAAAVLQQGTLDPYLALRQDRVVARLCTVRQGAGKVLVSWPDFPPSLADPDKQALFLQLLAVASARPAAPGATYLEFKLDHTVPLADLWQQTVEQAGFALVASAFEAEDDLDRDLPLPETPGTDYTAVGGDNMALLEEVFLACHVQTQDRLMTDSNTNLSQYFRDMCSANGALFEPKSAHIAWQGDPPHKVPVGLGFGSVDWNSDPSVGWVSLVVVHPDVRRQRLGVALSRRVINGMREAGAKKVRVLIDEVNEASSRMQKATTGHRIPGWFRTFRKELPTAP